MSSSLQQKFHESKCPLVLPTTIEVKVVKGFSVLVCENMSTDVLFLKNVCNIYIIYLYCSASKGSLESLGNITATSRKSNNPSINDFQDFVSEMQKTITSLRKQVVNFFSLF